MEHQAWVLDIDDEDDEALVKWETTGMTAWVPRTSIHQKLETRRRKKGETFCSYQDFQKNKEDKDKDNTKNTKNTQNTQNTLWKQVSVGSTLSVYWKDDDQYCNATVVKQRGTSSMFRLEYDDGDNEWLDLSQHQFSLLSNDNTTTTTKSWKDVSVGCRIAVYWKDDDKYYNATVVNPGSASPGALPSIFSLQYDDGEAEQLNLSQHCFQLMDEKPIDTHTDTDTDTCSSIDKNLWEQVSDGSRIAVYWKDDATYYKATVLKQRGSMCSLKYDDGERERLDMSDEIFTLLDQQRCRTKVHDKSSETMKMKGSHADYHNKLMTREQKRHNRPSRKTKRQQEEKNASCRKKSKPCSLKQGANTAAEKATVSKAEEYVATPQKAQREKNKKLSAAYCKEQEPTLETTGLDPILPNSTELPQSTLSGCSQNQSRTNSLHDRAPGNDDHEGNDTLEIMCSTTVQICIKHEEASRSPVESLSKELLPVSCSSSTAELLLEKNRLLLRKRLTGPRKKRILRVYEMELSTAATESF
jgi:hypothetical protein